MRGSSRAVYRCLLPRLRRYRVALLHYACHYRLLPRTVSALWWALLALPDVLPYYHHLVRSYFLPFYLRFSPVPTTIPFVVLVCSYRYLTTAILTVLLPFLPGSTLRCGRLVLPLLRDAALPRRVRYRLAAVTTAARYRRAAKQPPCIHWMIATRIPFVASPLFRLLRAHATFTDYHNAFFVLSFFRLPHI